MAMTAATGKAKKTRKVRFHERFSWKPDSSVTIDYQPGEKTVSEACARAAIAAGKAVEISAPKKRKASDDGRHDKGEMGES